VTLNRMRCRTDDGETGTTVRVAALRRKLGIAPHDPDAEVPKTVSVDAAAKRLGISVGSVHKLIRSGALPATQIMYSAPWKIPFDVLESDAVRIGLQEIAARKPRHALAAVENSSLKLPGF
jgi:excisionase family DNA binding protein